MDIWTREEVEAILLQLDHQCLPFPKYALHPEEDGLCLLGTGASSYVYRAQTRKKRKPGFAIKVIGLKSTHVDSEAFQSVVEAQKELAQFENNVVKIYDTAELWVWIEGEHTVAKAQRADAEEMPEGNVLHLQFMLMEEISPILKKGMLRQPSLVPPPLQHFDEQEILKLAFDIGTAIQHAHAKNILHRDIKPENIFYTPKGGHYKLGDFGIARKTSDGLASTVAFTNGYGAPEVVGTLEDKYDGTADIYSFGMVLYVLLNELRFPASNNYHPNVMQYTRGFAAQEPLNGSDALCRVVLRMISFDPDDRYQSMDEVLNELEKIGYGKRVKFQREHREASLIFGAAFAFMGAVLWKLSFTPFAKVDFSVGICIYLLLCIWKGVKGLTKKESVWIGIGMLPVGIWLASITGWTWWKLLLLIFTALLGEVATGIFGGAILLIKMTEMLISRYPDTVPGFADLKWVTVTLLSLALILIFYHFILGERDPLITALYLGKNTFWIVVLAYYAILLFYGWQLESGSGKLLHVLFSALPGLLQADVWKPMRVGAAGAAFCLIWMVRENFLIWMEKKREDGAEKITGRRYGV